MSDSPWGPRGRAGSQNSHAAAMGGLKDELLKAIWHAFTALDLDHSGKVSKSQLKVGAPPQPPTSESPSPTLPGARSTTPRWWKPAREGSEPRVGG